MRIGGARRTYFVEPLTHAAAGCAVAGPAEALHAPDYTEPLLGWRSWFLVRLAGAARLCSSCYSTVWEPRRALVASCREHTAPSEGCECGIYASSSPREAAPFLICPSRARVRAVGRVVGQVALWGNVVECTEGWRGALAYPVHLYVPTGPHLRSGTEQGVGRWWKPTYRPLPVSELETALGVYGVPVEFLPCDSVGELTQMLEQRLAQTAPPSGLHRRAVEGEAVPVPT
jgi:hypothetical protein